MKRNTLATTIALTATVVAVPSLIVPLHDITAYAPWISREILQELALASVFGTLLCALWLNNLFINAQEQKVEAEHRLLDSLEHISDSLFSVDRDWRFTFLNNQAALEHGVQRADVIGKRIWDVFQGVANLEFGRRLKCAMDQREPTEFEDCDAAGTLYRVKTFPSGNGITVVYQNLSEQKRLQDQIAMHKADLERRCGEVKRVKANLSALMCVDALTGLKNHAAFQDHFKGEFRRCVRYGSPLSIAIIDIDQFKTYNDHFGHPAGDELLRMIGRLLTEELRATDFVARYEGGQFAVILPETDQPGAVELAERVRSKTEASEWPMRGITVSVGIASVDVDSGSAAAVIQEACQALRESKSAGRNRVSIYSAPILAKAA